MLSGAAAGLPTRPEEKPEEGTLPGTLPTRGETRPTGGTLPEGTAGPTSQYRASGIRQDGGSQSGRCRCRALPGPPPGPPARGAVSQLCLGEGEEGPPPPAYRHQLSSSQRRGKGKSQPTTGLGGDPPLASRPRPGGGDQEVQVLTEELNRRGLAYVWGLMGLPGSLARIMIDSEACRKEIETEAHWLRSAACPAAQAAATLPSSGVSSGGPPSPRGAGSPSIAPGGSQWMGGHPGSLWASPAGSSL